MVGCCLKIVFCRQRPSKVNILKTQVRCGGERAKRLRKSPKRLLAGRAILLAGYDGEVTSDRPQAGEDLWEEQRSECTSSSNDAFVMWWSVALNAHKSFHFHWTRASQHKSLTIIWYSGSPLLADVLPKGIPHSLSDVFIASLTLL